jgi:hypothetical protein
MNTQMQIAAIDARVVALHEILLSLVSTFAIEHRHCIPSLVDSLQRAALKTDARSTPYVLEVAQFLRHGTDLMAQLERAEAAKGGKA